MGTDDYALKAAASAELISDGVRAGKLALKRKQKEREKREEERSEGEIDEKEAEDKLYKLFVGLNYKHRNEIEKELIEAGADLESVDGREEESKDRIHVFDCESKEQVQELFTDDEIKREC